MNTSFLYIRVNKNCNAHCFMCDFWKNPILQITMEQYLKAIKHYSSLKNVRFTGGEPLLHEQLYDYIRIAHEKDLNTSIITNGFFLDEKLDKLVSCGLDHIIISVDSCYQSHHDSLRGTPGLFNRIVTAIHHIKISYPYLQIRINTVVSEKNVQELVEFCDWIDENSIDQWALIPLKSREIKKTSIMSISEYIDHYQKFQKRAKSCKAQIMGYSDNWVESIEDYLCGKQKIHPKGKCHLTRFVSFYDPFSDHFYPCNCIPHRSIRFNSCEEEAQWYFDHGSNYCDGCEPLNAWCSDYPEVFETNKFIF